jgi:hypothetical protein
MGATKKRNGMWGYLLTGVVILSATVAVLLFGANSRPSQEIGPLLAGLAVSILLFRFGTPWKWLTVVLLVCFFVIGFLLGLPGIFWMGGYISGSNLGVAWRLAVIRDKLKAEWMVDDRGFDTLTEARKSAREALHSLDGRNRGRMFVEHGTARFEVAGTAMSRLVCHRSFNAEQEGSWAILSRSPGPEGDSVEVPMGSAKGYIPSRFVHDVGPVEAALEEFLGDPASKTPGPEWNTEEIASDLRLST